MSNYADKVVGNNYFDSCDAQRRIDWLLKKQKAMSPEDFDNHDYLSELNVLQETKKKFIELFDADSWGWGATFVLDEYFEEFAQDEADSLGLVDYDKRHQWPYNHIDWAEAAEELKNDYEQLTVGIHTYWVRGD